MLCILGKMRLRYGVGQCGIAAIPSQTYDLDDSMMKHEHDIDNDKQDNN